MTDGPLRHPSVMHPVAPLSLTDAVATARLAEHTGSRWWHGHSAVLDPGQVAAALAGAGCRIAVGSAVTLMPLLHPWMAANQARSVAMLTGQPVVLGLGALDPVGYTALTGRQRRPVRYVSEYLTAVRALLHDGAAHVDGDELSVNCGFLRLPTAPVEIGLGVLRPGLARVAGRLADVAISWLTGPTYVAGTLLPAIRGAAEAADREPPRMVTMLPVAVRRHGRDPVRTLATGHNGHLSMPHYRAVLAQQGVPADLDPFGAAREMVDGGLYAFGDPDDVVDRIIDMHRAGVDEVVLNTAGVWATEGRQAALEDLRDITDAVADRLRRSSVAPSGDLEMTA